MRSSILLRPNFGLWLCLCLGCAFFLWLPSLHSADYHVSNSGNNTHSGSAAQPWRTIAHALERVRNGDRVLLERGGVFREGGLTVSSGITVSHYGDPAAAPPVVSGSALVAGFSPSSSNPSIYQATANPGGNVSQVFVNGQFMTLAREPNLGSWFRTLPNTTTNEIRSNLGTPSGHWAGAQVRWRKWSWWYETRPVTSDPGGGRLVLGGSSAIPEITGIDSGFYIDNSLNALDAPEEWFWDPSSRRLDLIPPTGVNPANMRVEVLWRTSGFLLTGGTLDGVTVEHFADVGVEINRPSTVINCTIRHIENIGVRSTWDCAGSRVAHCVIEDILNTGILWIENPGASGGSAVEYNRLTRIGNRNGLGASGTWKASGIIVHAANGTGNGVRIRYNRITETGYAGVILGSDGQFVEHNVFLRCMNTHNDGAAIYTNCNASVITGNIILDTVGDMESAQPFYPLGHGIWPEFLENFRDTQITGNTIYGSGGNGVFLPNNFDCTIADNIMLSNRTAGLNLEAFDNGTALNQNHLISNNLFGIGARPWVSTRPENLATWANPDDRCFQYDIKGGRSVDFGTMSASVFVTQNGQDLVANSSGNSISLVAWQNEQPSWADSSPTSVLGLAFLFINDTGSSFAFPLPSGISWRRLNGASIDTSVEIAPFRSVVLLAHSGNSSSLPGYFLASEIPVNQSPVLAPIGHKTVEAGDAIEFTINASDPEGQELDFGAYSP